MPELFVIAGCYGAGKTTASFTILPDMLHCEEFVNPVEIAREDTAGVWRTSSGSACLWPIRGGFSITPAESQNK